MEFSLLDTIILAGCAAGLCYAVYIFLTLEKGYREHYRRVQETGWEVCQWYEPWEIFMCYWLFFPTILIPVVVWLVLFDEEVVPGLVLFTGWFLVVVVSGHYTFMRPSLRGVSFKARNRGLELREVMSAVEGVLYDLEVPFKRYSKRSYRNSGPDRRLSWHMLWFFPAAAVYDIYPGSGRNMSVMVYRDGDLGINHTQALMTPYGKETAELFDHIAEGIDELLP